jgi:hypothetical protein
MSIDILGSPYTVWEERAYSNILFKRNTISFDPSINLTNYDTGASTAPAIAASGNNVCVVWDDNSLGNFEIFYKRSTNGGDTFGSTVNLSNVTAAGGTATPAIAASNNLT